MVIQIDQQIFRIQLKSIIPAYPTLFIRIYDETDSLLEEITGIISTYNGSQCSVINHIEFDGKRRYVYQNDKLTSSRKRVMKIAKEEIDKIVESRFQNLFKSGKNFYFEDCGYKKEQAIRSIRQKKDFSYIIKKVEESRDIKVTFETTDEKMPVLLKKMNEN